MRFSTNTFFIHVLFLLIVNITSLQVQKAYAASFNAIVNYGDSLTDGGNDATAYGSVYKQIGDPFPALPGYPHVPTLGYRYADDYTFPEYMAQYLNMFNTSQFYNFAVGGLRTGNLIDRINYSRQFRSIDANTLYIIELGQTDMTSNITPETASTNIVNGLQHLYNLGARQFLVSNTILGGDLPAYLNNSASSNQIARNITINFNNLLASKISALSFANNVYLFDYAAMMTYMKQYPFESGFTNVINNCIYDASRGGFCNNIEDYAFWDTVHITSHTHELIALLSENMISKPSNFLSVALLKPLDQTTVNAGQTVSISAIAVNSKNGGSINRVEFYDNGNLIHTSNNKPYTHNWTANGGQTHQLTAKVFDGLEQSITSKPINISVLGGVQNQAPSINLNNPIGNTGLTTGNITAIANDIDGSISKVEFYVNNNLFATLTNAPYTLGWSDAPNGVYSVMAKAYDNQNANTNSNTVTVTINSNTTTNKPPIVTLNQPVATTGNVSGSMTAEATDSDGQITKVEFYINGNMFATVTNAPYTIGWSNAPSGTYAVNVKAFDNQGLTTTSNTVTVTISR